MRTGLGPWVVEWLSWAGQAIFQGETDSWFIVTILLIFDELRLSCEQIG